MDSMKEYSIQDLWEILTDLGEFTVLIAAEDEQRLKKALINKKNRINEKLKSAGLPPSKDQLEFEKASASELGKVYFKAILREQISVNVFEMIIPSPTGGTTHV